MLIYLNGKALETAPGSSLHTIRRQQDPLADVVILNGFQTAEDLRIRENDSIVLIKKGASPSQEELESMMAARHTPEVHKRLKKAKVAIAGLGGVGSNIAVLLARIGVGTLLLVDFDIVEPSNLNRQSYNTNHLGLEKTEAMQAQIAQINPFIKIIPQTVKVSEENAVSLFGAYPIVCEAFDNPVSKSMLVNTLLEKKPEIKIVSASGLAGFTSSNSIVTRQIFKNLYVCGDMVNEAQIGNGLMAPRVTICAAHQANMVLRLIMGIEEV